MPEGFCAGLVHDLPAAVVVLDLDGAVVHANPYALRLFGVDRLGGLGLDDLISDDSVALVAEYLHSLVAGPHERSVHLGPLRVEWGGSEKYVDIDGRLLSSVPGFRGITLHLRDITAYEQSRRDYEALVDTDGMTGLLSRRAFVTRVEAVAAAEMKAVVMFLDLDRFKRINDEFGHAVGDAVLIEVANRLQDAAPIGSVLARYGGDEFAMLVPDLTIVEAAGVEANLAAAVSNPRPFAVAEGDVDVTISIGSAPLRRDVNRSIMQADMRLYRAKRNLYNGTATLDLRSLQNRARNLLDENETLRAQVHQLHQESRTDAGTGLANLRLLLEDLEALDARSARGDRDYGVVFLDLDYFGLLNKTLGDDGGDRTLRTVADILSATCREGEKVYRKGGEELVVLLHDSDLDGATLAADRFRRAVEEAELVHGGHPDNPIVTVSIGVAAGPADDFTAAQVMARAGLAMLTAKQNGRNRVESEPLWELVGDEGSTQD